LDSHVGSCKKEGPTLKRKWIYQEESWRRTEAKSGLGGKKKNIPKRDGRIAKKKRGVKRGERGHVVKESNQDRI